MWAQRLKANWRAFWAMARRYPVQLYASSLTYYTLIALVPLLAFWLGLLEWLGIDDLFHVIMHGFLDPMGHLGEQVGSTLFDFVHNTHSGLVQQFSVLFLFGSMFVLIYKIDHTLNRLWDINITLNRALFWRWGKLFLFALLCSLLLMAIKSFPYNVRHLLSYLLMFVALSLLFYTIPQSESALVPLAQVRCFV